MAKKQNRRPINLFEYEELASKVLSKMAYDFFSGGACDEITVKENLDAFRRSLLCPRVLAGREKPDTTTTLLGQALSVPVFACPTAFHGLAHENAEKATVRGVGAAGSLMILSVVSNEAVEDVVAEATGPVWMQLNVFKDRGITRSCVE
jgi:4-hydroxymandelate oxidase